MPSRHQISRKKRRAIEAANEVKAAVIRRKKKIKRAEAAKATSAE